MRKRTVLVERENDYWGVAVIIAIVFAATILAIAPFVLAARYVVLQFWPDMPILLIRIAMGIAGSLAIALTYFAIGLYAQRRPKKRETK